MSGPSEELPQADAFAQACYEGDDGAVAAMLARGADPEAPDAQGRSPLERAAVCDRASTVRLLAGAGAALDRQDALGDTALAVACWFGCLDAARALLDLGADPSIANLSGRLPLHHACSDGLAAEAILLIERGGFDERPDANGDTALDLAIRAGGSACARALAQSWSLEGLAAAHARWEPLLTPRGRNHWVDSLRAAPANIHGSPQNSWTAPANALKATDEPWARKALEAELRGAIADPAQSGRPPRV